MASTTTTTKTFKTKLPAAVGAPLPVAVVEIPTESHAALEAKYHANLASLEARRTGILHIAKIRQPIRAIKLFELYQKGCVKIADWNRDEVTTREGTADEWMESLATKISPGHFIAYWVGTPGATGKIPEPTAANPIIIYEGGHRTRWTQKTFSNEATFCGMTYETIKTLRPTIAEAIENVEIDMTVAVSTDAQALVKFAKQEYDKVNSLVETLKPGELIRTRLDDDRATLEDSLKAALQREIKEKDRDVHLEDLRALTNGAAGMPLDMNKKKGTLTKTTPLTEDQKTKARTVIALVATAEQQIRALPELNTPALQKRVLKRQLDLAIDGTFIYALQDAVNDETRQQVVADWVEFHRRFFVDGNEWKVKMSGLKKSTTDRGRYRDGQTPFPERWQQKVRNVLHPPQVVVGPLESIPEVSVW